MESVTQMRNVQLITGLHYSLPQIEDVTDKLVKHKSKTWEIRKPEDIDTIIIHHTASTSPLANQANYHVNSHDWAGISYHLVVDEGKLKQTNDLLSFTYHAADHNAHSIAICINWDLRLRDLTSLERELLYGAILTVKSLFNISALIGHNEVNSTSCPCTSLNRIREDIQTLEMKMNQQDTWEAKLGKVGDIANQVNYMMNLLKNGPDDGESTWAMNNLMDTHEIMKQQGLL